MSAASPVQVVLLAHATALVVTSLGVQALLALTLFVTDALNFRLLATILLAPATLLYIKARTEHGHSLFTPTEMGVFALIVIGAVGLWTGQITL